MGECYGTLYYLQQNTDRVKRTVAAMCIDSPAGLQNLAGTEHTWILNPHSAKSYVDAFVLRLAAEYYPDRRTPLALGRASQLDRQLSRRSDHRHPDRDAAWRIWRARASQQRRHARDGRPEVAARSDGDECCLYILHRGRRSGGEAVDGGGGAGSRV